MKLCELRERDIHNLNRIVARLERVQTWDACGSVLASGLRGLIGSEYCIYNETNLSETVFTRQYVT